MSRIGVLAVLASAFLSGCAYLGLPNPFRAGAVDPTVARYHGAMTDLARCVTTSDPAMRQAMAARLARSAQVMLAETRPRNPDHFYMTDRVRAAALYCADSLRSRPIPRNGPRD